MDESDYDTFERAFRRLGSVFRLRLKEPDMKELASTYFRILHNARLEAVLAAAKVCLTHCTTFPKPVEWLNALPSPAVVTQTVDRRAMTSDEAAEYDRAERLRYEDAPCACSLCQIAGVTHRSLRFVPNFTADDREERAIYPLKNSEVVTGHWAHGDELARWYAARDHFYGLRGTVAPRIHALLPRALRERVPGEEG